MVLALILINSCKKDKKEEPVSKKTPIITWENPEDIVYETLLSTTQLNATANVPGTFSYTPAIGTKLIIGTNQDLKVDFIPTDATTYNNASKTVKINVSLAIGDSYRGGIIAYILQVGDSGYIPGETHGLITASVNQDPPVVWYNATLGYTTTGAIATIIGTGNANTQAIYINQGNTENYAAKKCMDYRGGGYSDWYLPSKDELNKLYINKILIGGFVNEAYWSSSENSITTACYQGFIHGDQNVASKSVTCRVRAIRSF